MLFVSLSCVYACVCMCPRVCLHVCACVCVVCVCVCVLVQVPFLASRPGWLSWMRVRLVVRRLRVRLPPDRHHSFLEIDQEIFSTVILSLPLIQEGQVSVSGERMCTILVNRLED